MQSIDWADASKEFEAIHQVMNEIIMNNNNAPITSTRYVMTHRAFSEFKVLRGLHEV